MILLCHCESAAGGRGNLALFKNVIPAPEPESMVCGQASRPWLLDSRFRGNDKVGNSCSNDYLLTGDA